MGEQVPEYKENEDELNLHEAADTGEQRAIDVERLAEGFDETAPGVFEQDSEANETVLPHFESQNEVAPVPIQERSSAARDSESGMRNIYDKYASDQELDEKDEKQDILEEFSELQRNAGHPASREREASPEEPDILQEFSELQKKSARFAEQPSVPPPRVLGRKEYFGREIHKGVRAARERIARTIRESKEAARSARSLKTERRIAAERERRERERRERAVVESVRTETVPEQHAATKRTEHERMTTPQQEQLAGSRREEDPAVLEMRREFAHEYLKLFLEQSPEAAGLGIGAEEEQALIQFLEHEARDNPERFAERLRVVRKVNETADTIRKNEEQIEYLGGTDAYARTMKHLVREQEELKYRLRMRSTYLEKPASFSEWLLSRAWHIAGHPKVVATAFLTGGALIASGMLGGAGLIAIPGIRLGIRWFETRGLRGEAEHTVVRAMDGRSKKERALYFDGVRRELHKKLQMMHILEGSSPARIAARKELIASAREKLIGEFAGSSVVYKSLIARGLANVEAFVADNRQAELRGEPSPEFNDIQGIQRTLAHIEALHRRVSPEHYTTRTFDAARAAMLESAIEMQLERRVSDYLSHAVSELPVGGDQLGVLANTITPFLNGEHVDLTVVQRRREMIVRTLRTEITRLRSTPHKGRGNAAKLMRLKQLVKMFNALELSES